MSLLLALTGSAPSVTAALAWTEENDTCAIAVTVVSTAQPSSGGWERLSVKAHLERLERRRQLEQEIAEPILEAIQQQSKTRFESFEEEERAIRKAAEAARIEYQALYMRLLASLREEAQAEEEAVVMMMFAALSE